MPPKNHRVDYDREEVARRLRTFKDRQGCSNADIGRQAGVTAQAVGKWLSGQTVPSPEQWERLAEMGVLPPDPESLRIVTVRSEDSLLAEVEAHLLSIEFHTRQVRSLLRMRAHPQVSDGDAE